MQMCYVGSPTLKSVDAYSSVFCYVLMTTDVSQTFVWASWSVHHMLHM